MFRVCVTFHSCDWVLGTDRRDVESDSYLWLVQGQDQTSEVGGGAICMALGSQGVGDGRHGALRVCSASRNHMNVPVRRSREIRLRMQWSPGSEAVWMVLPLCPRTTRTLYPPSDATGPHRKHRHVFEKTIWNSNRIICFKNFSRYQI